MRKPLLGLGVARLDGRTGLVLVVERLAMTR
jgi:hypothetical protein